MKLRSAISMTILAAALALTSQTNGCTEGDQPVSSSGVQKATASVTPGSDGLTVEQRNVRDRLATDNKIGSLKHLYIISAYSGQVILYSTVKGKVTSSGKRLSPFQINGNKNSGDSCTVGFNVQIGNANYCTTEVLQDDGTYGDSIPYIYWFDAQGRYHQQYISGGMMVHVSDQPIPVKSVTINLEVQ